MLCAHRCQSSAHQLLKHLIAPCKQHHVFCADDRAACVRGKRLDVVRGRFNLRPHGLCQGRDELRRGVAACGRARGVDERADGQPEGLLELLFVLLLVSGMSIAHVSALMWGGGSDL